MDTKTSAMTFHVGYMCKYCELIFKSPHEFCCHKVEFHLTKLTKSRCIVFEESIVEPTETELTNFGNAVTVVQVQPQFNAIKTEWVEETSIKYDPSQENEDLIESHANSVNDPQENEYFLKNNYHNTAETEANFVGQDAEADVNPTQPLFTNLQHNQQEHSNVTQSTESMSSSTFTAETDRQYFSENQSDSDDDIICLDDDSLPSTTSKIPKPTGPTATTTTAGLNNSIFSQLALKCEICSKQFSSSAQLGIHVGICKLYNRGKTVTSPGPGPGLASVIHGREEPVIQKDILMVQCQECSKLVRSRNFKKHTKYHQLRARREFVCQLCGSAFGSKENLAVHAGVHSDEIPYKCTFPGCHAAFKYKSGLYKHSKHHAN